MTDATTSPTQVKHPWRATLRTVAAGVGTALLGVPALYALAPDIVREAGWDGVPVVVAGIGILGAITRVLALPQVDAWLRRNVNALAAKP